jgi:hypothetical protein
LRTTTRWTWVALAADLFRVGHAAGTSLFVPN